jgi:hypothetical protein
MAFLKPTKVPRWADDGLNTVEPAEAKKDLGWVFEEPPPSSYENWIQNTTGDWMKWLNEIIFDEGALSRIFQGVNSDTAVADQTAGSCVLSGGASTGNAGSTVLFRIAESGQGAGLAVRAPVGVAAINSLGIFEMEALPAAARTLRVETPVGASREGIEINTKNNTQTGVDLNLGATDIGLSIDGGAAGIDLINNATALNLLGNTTGVDITGSTTGVSIDTTTTGIDIAGGTTGAQITGATTGIGISGSGSIGVNINALNSFGALVLNDGSGDGVLLVNFAGSTGHALSINNTTSNASGISLTNTTTAPGILVNHTAASGNAIDISVSAGARGVFIDHAGNGSAILIDTSTGRGITIQGSSNGDYPLFINRGNLSPAIQMEPGNFGIPNGISGGLLVDQVGAFRTGDTPTVKYHSPTILLHQESTFTTIPFPQFPAKTTFLNIPIPSSMRNAASFGFVKGLLHVEVAIDAVAAGPQSYSFGILYGGATIADHTTSALVGGQEDIFVFDFQIDQTAINTIDRAVKSIQYTSAGATIASATASLPLPMAAADQTLKMLGWVNAGGPSDARAHSIIATWTPAPN